MSGIETGSNGNEEWLEPKSEQQEQSEGTQDSGFEFFESPEMQEIWQRVEGGEELTSDLFKAYFEAGQKLANEAQENASNFDELVNARAVAYEYMFKSNELLAIGGHAEQALKEMESLLEAISNRKMHPMISAEIARRAEASTEAIRQHLS